MWWRTLKFLFSKNATKIDEIFTVDLTLCSKCQIDGEDFVIFCGSLRKHELYRRKWRFRQTYAQPKCDLLELYEVCNLILMVLKSETCNSFFFSSSKSFPSDIYLAQRGGLISNCRPKFWWPTTLMYQIYAKSQLYR